MCASVSSVTVNWLAAISCSSSSSFSGSLLAFYLPYMVATSFQVSSKHQVFFFSSSMSKAKLPTSSFSKMRGWWNVMCDQKRYYTIICLGHHSHLLDFNYNAHVQQKVEFCWCAERGHLCHVTAFDIKSWLFPSHILCSCLLLYCGMLRYC